MPCCLEVCYPATYHCCFVLAEWKKPVKKVEENVKLLRVRKHRRRVEKVRGMSWIFVRKALAEGKAEPLRVQNCRRRIGKVRGTSWTSVVKTMPNWLATLSLTLWKTKGNLMWQVSIPQHISKISILSCMIRQWRGWLSRMRIWTHSFHTYLRHSPSF